MPENRFVGEAAWRYDEDASGAFAPDVVDAAVEVLADLGGGGPALEFAIGTGRIAIPLAARGVEVAGVDLSGDMLAALKAKPGANRIRAVEGDMATTNLDRTFTLVYLVFNTITNLTTQEEQVACFRNAARHLRPGGRFLIESGVPSACRLLPGSTAVPFALTEDHLGVDEFIDRTHRQLARSRHLWRNEDGTFREFSVPFRYVWPSELDLMARIAGLTLEQRWADWDRTAFDGESRSHVSVWRRVDI